MPLATTFKYASDVGTDSVPGIKLAAADSGLVPPLIDTNDYDPPPTGGGYHLTHNAVDWSNGGDKGTPEMDKFAAWVALTYGVFCLEIIHVNQDGTTVEWKMGQQMPTGWYGQATLAQHHNHVHWAITNSGLAAGQNRDPNPTSAQGIALASTFTANAADFWQDINPLDPTSWVKPFVNAIFKPLVNYMIDAGLVVGGMILILLGLFLLFREFGIGKGAAATIQTAGARAAEIGAMAA